MPLWPRMPPILLGSRMFFTVRVMCINMHLTFYARGITSRKKASTHIRPPAAHTCALHTARNILRCDWNILHLCVMCMCRFVFPHSFTLFVGISPLSLFFFGPFTASSYSIDKCYKNGLHYKLNASECFTFYAHIVPMYSVWFSFLSFIVGWPQSTLRCHPCIRAVKFLNGILVWLLLSPFEFHNLFVTMYFVRTICFHHRIKFLWFECIISNFKPILCAFRRFWAWSAH